FSYSQVSRTSMSTTPRSSHAAKSSGPISSTIHPSERPPTVLLLLRGTSCLPGALRVRELHHVPEAPAAQQAGHDGRPPAAVAVDDQLAALRHLGDAPQHLTGVDVHRAGR